MAKAYDRTTMLQILFFLFFGLSLLANAILVPLAGYWLYLRGGLRHFRLDSLKGNRPLTPSQNRREMYHAFNSSRLTEHPVVMFGDSLTAAGLWPEWYDTEVINRGIGGETTADGLSRVSDIATLHPSKIFILFGTNDSATLSADATIGNMRQIIGALRASSPTSEIYIQSLFPPMTLARAPWVTQVNEGYKRLAEEYGVHWLDLGPAFADGPVIQQRLTVDGIHLSPEGYDVWRRTVEPYIKAPSAELGKASRP
jgi:lysophospholipase L1-like esterase